MSMDSAEFRKGLGLGLIVAGFGMYSLILRHVPHLLFGAALAGVLAGAGIGSGFHTFIWSRRAEPIRERYLAQRRYAPLKGTVASVILIVAAWLLTSTTVSRVFFIALFIAIGVSLVLWRAPG